MQHTREDHLKRKHLIIDLLNCMRNTNQKKSSYSYKCKCNKKLNVCYFK